MEWELICIISHPNGTSYGLYSYSDASGAIYLCSDKKPEKWHIAGYRRASEALRQKGL
jgi:hypothetical protein